jgi:hypothetical protein
MDNYYLMLGMRKINGTWRMNTEVVQPTNQQETPRMKLYDIQGNELEVKDYRGNVVNDEARTATIIGRTRTGQFRLNPMIFWSAWAGVAVCLLVGAIVLGLGILKTSYPVMFFSTVPLLSGITGAYILYGYYSKFGVPLVFKEAPKEFYCKKCEAKIEKDLEIANQEKIDEALSTLESLTGEEFIPKTPQLEAPTSAHPPTPTRAERPDPFRNQR